MSGPNADPRRLAKVVVIDVETGRITIDGEEFPFFVGGSIDLSLEIDPRPSIITLNVLAEHVVLEGNLAASGDFVFDGRGDLS